MAEPLSGFERLPGGRLPGDRARPALRTLAAMIAAALILGCGLLAGRLFLGSEPAPPPAPGPSRSAA
jgi:hypothetical protein